MLIKGRVIQDHVKRFCMFKTVAVSLSVISCSNTALKWSDTNDKMTNGYETTKYLHIKEGNTQTGLNKIYESYP